MDNLSTQHTTNYHRKNYHSPSKHNPHSMNTHTYTYYTTSMLSSTACCCTLQKCLQSPSISTPWNNTQTRASLWTQHKLIHHHIFNERAPVSLPGHRFQAKYITLKHTSPPPLPLPPLPPSLPPSPHSSLVLFSEASIHLCNFPLLFYQVSFSSVPVLVLSPISIFLRSLFASYFKQNIPLSYSLLPSFLPLSKICTPLSLPYFQLSLSIYSLSVNSHSPLSSPLVHPL